METVLYLEAKTKGQRQSWYFMMMLHYVTAVKIVLPIEVSTINSTELLLYLQINYILQRTTEKEDFNFPSQSNVFLPVFNDYLSDASILNPSATSRLNFLMTQCFHCCSRPLGSKHRRLDASIDQSTSFTSRCIIFGWTEEVVLVQHTLNYTSIQLVLISTTQVILKTSAPIT